MSTEWYYESLGQAVGPLTAKELLQKIRSGEISHSTPIRKNDSQWVPAEEVTGLFEAAQRPLLEHICPYCGAKVPPPPVTCKGCQRYLQRTYTTRNSTGGRLNRKARRNSRPDPSGSASSDDDRARQDGQRSGSAGPHPPAVPSGASGWRAIAEWLQSWFR